MHKASTNRLESVKRQVKTWVGLGLLVLLAACGSSVTPSAPTAQNYLLSLAIQSSDQPSDLLRRYGGEVVVWVPGKRAVLRLDAQAATALRGRGVSVQNYALEADLTLKHPELEASGWNAWAGGWNAWAGGWNAWAGGWNAWAGGSTTPQPPIENQTAWEQIGLSQAQAASYRMGYGVKVAVLDTGLDLTHPIFQGRLAEPALWRDYVDGDAQPQEENSQQAAYGHGTAVAGLVLQVAPKVQILPIRVMDSSGKALLSEVLAGIYWAADHADVINFSLGSLEPSQALYEAISYAAEQGVYVVASAGNAGRLDAITYPARYTWWDNTKGHVFGVASADGNNLLSNFSSYGWDLFISAPGERLTTAYPAERLVQATGTSFATPLVSGSVALLLGEAEPSQRGQLAYALQTGSLKGGVHDKNLELRNTDRIGAGVLDVESALYNLPHFTPKNPGYMIKRFDFEHGIESWSLYGTVTADGQPYSGQGALRIMGYGVANQILSGLKPNTHYRASVWVQASGFDSKHPPGLNVWGFDPDGISANNRSTSLVVGRSGYTQLSLTFTTDSSTSVALGLWSHMGTAVFDYFELTEVVQ